MAETNMNRILEIIRNGWIGGIIGAVLALPVAVYIRTFGFTISNSHQRWAEMGSALSGIYGPILAVLTLLVLNYQIQLQKQTNKHMFHQAHLQDSRADVEFYLMQIVSALDKQLPGEGTVRAVLHSRFERATIEQLKEEQLKRSAYAFYADVPHLGAMWGAIYTIFAGLSASDESDYQNQYSSAKTKAVAMLSFGTCVALDNYAFALSTENPPYRFQFSRELAVI